MRTISIGTMTIDRVVEQGRFLFRPEWLFPRIDAATAMRYAERLGPALIDPDSRGLVLSFHSFLLRTRHHTILVDTCNGNHKHRPGVPWQHMRGEETYLANLARFGVRPDEIDYVLCTHLHGDHVGWNTRLVDGRWVPTFPKARYLMAQQDYEHFGRNATGPSGQPFHLSFADSIEPVVAAGRAELVEIAGAERHAIEDGVWLEAAPGHTPGHVVLHAKGAGGRAVICGDVIHHPIQFAEPQLVNGGDADPAMAQRTRRDLLAATAADHAVLLTAHFPDPTAGYVLPAGDGFTFEFRQA